MRAPATASAIQRFMEELERSRDSWSLPGADLVGKGLDDLRKGTESLESLLVSVGAPRLRRLGAAIPPPERLPTQPEHRLYDLLCATRGRSAYGDYNALIRRLVSYERALEAERGRETRRLAGVPADPGPSR